jgi:hypothetical protein
MSKHNRIIIILFIVIAALVVIAMVRLFVLV